MLMLKRYGVEPNWMKIPGHMKCKETDAGILQSGESRVGLAVTQFGVEQRKSKAKQPDKQATKTRQSDAQ